MTIRESLLTWAHWNAGYASGKAQYDQTYDRANSMVDCVDGWTATPTGCVRFYVRFVEWRTRNEMQAGVTLTPRDCWHRLRRKTWHNCHRPLACDEGVDDRDPFLSRLTQCCRFDSGWIDPLLIPSHTHDLPISEPVPLPLP